MRTVFIIDDDPIHRMVMKKHFSTLGFNVKIFEHVESAMPAIREKPYLIVLDHFFDQSQTFGLEYIKLIKKQSKKTAIIYLTGSSDPEIISESLQTGADAYIQKNESFLVRLRTALDDIEAKHKKRCNLWPF